MKIFIFHPFEKSVLINLLITKVLHARGFLSIEKRLERFLWLFRNIHYEEECKFFEILNFFFNKQVHHIVFCVFYMHMYESWIFLRWNCEMIFCGGWKFQSLLRQMEIKREILKIHLYKQLFSRRRKNSRNIIRLRLNYKFVASLYHVFLKGKISSLKMGNLLEYYRHRAIIPQFISSFQRLTFHRDTGMENFLLSFFSRAHLKN